MQVWGMERMRSEKDLRKVRYGELQERRFKYYLVLGKYKNNYPCKRKIVVLKHLRERDGGIFYS